MGTGCPARTVAVSLFAGIPPPTEDEPRGGAHTNHELAATLLDTALGRALAGISTMSSEARLQARYEKWRAMGNVGLAES